MYVNVKNINASYSTDDQANDIEEAGAGEQYLLQENIHSTYIVFLRNGCTTVKIKKVNYGEEMGGKHDRKNSQQAESHCHGLFRHL